MYKHTLAFLQLWKHIHQCYLYDFNSMSLNAKCMLMHLLLMILTLLLFVKKKKKKALLHSNNADDQLLMKSFRWSNIFKPVSFMLTGIVWKRTGHTVQSIAAIQWRKPVLLLVPQGKQTRSRSDREKDTVQIFRVFFYVTRCHKVPDWCRGANEPLRSGRLNFGSDCVVHIELSS